MLPFTKRPARVDDSSGIVSRSAPLSGIRPPAESSDDERTNILHSHALTGSFPRPIEDDEEDECRTVVRDNPTSVVPRALGAKSVRPAAGQKASRGHIVPAPPADLIEEEQSDYSERLTARGNLRTPAPRSVVPSMLKDTAPSLSTGFAGKTQALDGAPNRLGGALEGPPSRLAGHLEGPPSHLAGFGQFEGPPSRLAGASFEPPAASRAFQRMPAPMSSVAPVAARPFSAAPAPASSLPAHFMVPRSSDPPAVAVSARRRSAGRPAVSWAAALLACGLFVGVAAVAVVQNNDAIADTTASFVDPARAPQKAAAAAQQAAPTQPAAEPPAPVAVAPVTAPAVVTPAAPVVVAAPSPPVVVAAAPAAPVVAAPKPAARPVYTWKPAPAPPRPAARAAAPPPADRDEEPAPKKVAASPKKSSASNKGEVDDETKKALEDLKKAQLESSSSFSKETP